MRGRFQTQGLNTFLQKIWSRQRFLCRRVRRQACLHKESFCSVRQDGFQGVACLRLYVSGHTKMRKMLSLPPRCWRPSGGGRQNLETGNCYTKAIRVLWSRCAHWRPGSTQGGKTAHGGEVREGFPEKLSLRNQEVEAHMLYFQSLLRPHHKVKRS